MIHLIKEFLSERTFTNNMDIIQMYKIYKIEYFFITLNIKKLLNTFYLLYI